MTVHLNKHIPNRPVPLADDTWLLPYRDCIDQRAEYVRQACHRCCGGDDRRLPDFASAHEYFGLHRDVDGNWIFREWAPNATRIFFIGECNNWCESRKFELAPVPDSHGHWALRLPGDALRHGMLYRLRIHWENGCGDRIPAYARRTVQDGETGIFNAQVWFPSEPYVWQHSAPAPAPPLIYEAHVGMCLEEPRVATFSEFRDRMLPRIAEGGYNTVQLMAVMEHPYYGSFGYHVSSFYAASSRFGLPEDLKSLVDTAHQLGLRVIIDLVHSHAVRNEVEGLARFDGTPHQFFHAGDRGFHDAWDSCCFDYGKPEVLHFLLSNCRFWLDEYRVDGFRFDGITSMLYHHHGLGVTFSEYGDYFGEEVDSDAFAYLTLANQLIHRLRPDAITIAEDVSGMPGLGVAPDEGGCGFDYRLAMGVTDFWFRLMDKPDEQWSVHDIWRELTERRPDERTVSYLECHDQAIVGGQTAIYRLIGSDMYGAMHKGSQSLSVDRGIALHKMMRLATAAAAGNGYLNFMGNEFGHPEWVDFPREGNQWSYHHARRLWSLVQDNGLRYGDLDRFDREMLHLLAEAGAYDVCPRLLCASDDDHVLVFERAGLFFFFNFSPDRSLPGFAVEFLPGEYEIVLDLDTPSFGGHGRVDREQKFSTTERLDGRILKHILYVYLPCRSAFVLRRC